MKSSAELKMEAKQMLQGRWKDAVLMNLVPALLQIGLAFVMIMIVLVPIITYFIITGPVDISSIDGSSATYTASAGSTIGSNAASSGGGLVGGLVAALFSVAISWTFLETLRGQRERFSVNDAFRGFSSPWLAGIVAIYLLQSLFTFLWTLLFVIPGLVKSYSYSQANFIYKDIIDGTGERPKFTDCITASRRLMDGYKGQLFWLDLSFIGWHLLAIATCGIGYLWLTPYIQATKAAFYNNLPQTSEAF